MQSSDILTGEGANSGWADEVANFSSLPDPPDNAESPSDESKSSKNCSHKRKYEEIPFGDVRSYFSSKSLFSQLNPVTQDRLIQKWSKFVEDNSTECPHKRKIVDDDGGSECPHKWIMYAISYYSHKEANHVLFAMECVLNHIDKNKRDTFYYLISPF